MVEEFYDEFEDEEDYTYEEIDEEEDYTTFTESINEFKQMPDLLMKKNKVDANYSEEEGKIRRYYIF